MIEKRLWIRRWFMAALALPVINRVMAAQQTAVPAEAQMRGLSSSGGMLLAVMPNGKVKQATLDGAVLDSSSNTPVLRVLPQTQPQYTPKRAYLTMKLQAGAIPANITIVMPGGGVAQSVMIDFFWNGLLMTEGVDYTLSNNVITPLRPFEADDVLTVKTLY